MEFVCHHVEVVETRVTIAFFRITVSRWLYYLLLLVDDNLGTSESTGSSGGDQTNLLTGGSVSRNSGRVANVLMVTTSVRMLDGVHRNTSNSGPAVALNLVLVVLVTGLHDWLIDSATAGNHTDHSSAGTIKGLSGTRGESDSGLLTIIGLADDDSAAARGLSQRSAVANLAFQVADHSTLGDLVDGQDVTDSELSVLAAVDELSTVHTLGSNEVALDQLVSVGVSEDNSRNRSSSARIVNDLSNNTLDIAVSLSKVQRSQLSSSLSVSGHSLEDTRGTLTLCTDNSSHK